MAVDPSCRCKFGYRARLKLNRRRRGFLPLRRQLIHNRLRVGTAFGRELILSLDEGLSILRGEIEPARCHPAPAPRIAAAVAARLAGMERLVDERLTEAEGHIGAALDRVADRLDLGGHIGNRKP